MLELWNHEDLEQALDTDAPVIIDFWSENCGPCRMSAPHYEAAAQTYEGKVVFAKVDTRRAQDLARAFNIRSVPTFAVLHHGEIMDVHVGGMNQAMIEKLAERSLARAEKAAAIEAAGGGLTGRLKVMFGRT